MASASDFLKKRTAARQQAESIQSSDKTPLGKNDDGTVTRASNFLRNKAAERRAVIDQQYGKDAYGGSGRYEADKAPGLQFLAGERERPLQPVGQRLPEPGRQIPECRRLWEVPG